MKQKYVTPALEDLGSLTDQTQVTLCIPFLGCTTDGGGGGGHS